MNILVLSGSDHVRFPTMINQRAYADRHGYRYQFDIAPRAGRTNLYNHKLSAIADALPLAEWLFWLDDDAAFTQLGVSFEARVPELAREDLSAIFCASPVNPQGGWTHLSSGNFFIRNDSVGRSLITKALKTDLSFVQTWWNSEQFGMYTHGDQDALVYQIETDQSIRQRTAILEYKRFNTRPYHFECLTDHFLVHFTNLLNTTKLDQMIAFSTRFGLTKHLLIDEDLAPYGSYGEVQLEMARSGQLHAPICLD